MLTDGFKKVIFERHPGCITEPWDPSPLGHSEAQPRQLKQFVCPVQKHHEGKQCCCLQSSLKMQLWSASVTSHLLQRKANLETDERARSVAGPATYRNLGCSLRKGGRGMASFVCITQCDAVSRYCPLSLLAWVLSLWPAISVCRELSCLPEQGAFSAEPRKILGKPGQVAYFACVTNGRFLSNGFHLICTFSSLLNNTPITCPL